MSHSLKAPAVHKEIEGIARKPTAERAALTLGAFAAILTGACCVLPLVLVTIGISGTWLSILPRFEPYQPIFIGAALVALRFAGWRLYRPAADCAPADVCGLPQVRRRYRTGFWIVAALLVGMIT
jgi:mercuric ion transport protein